MRIEQKPILDVLGTADVRYTIPVFQRVYSWTARQCEELWEDIMRAGRTGNPHFMGLVLCSRDADVWHGVEQFNVIDGQQRLTTITLLLVALLNQIKDESIAWRFLLAQADDKLSPKLVLSGMDFDTLAALVGAAETPEAPAQRLLDNCLIFADKMAAPDFDIDVFKAGLVKLETALVMLDTDDSPQLVFESLNSKGMPLSTADRVRNLILVSDGEIYGGEGVAHTAAAAHDTGVASADAAHDTTQEGSLYERYWMGFENLLATTQPPISINDVLQSWLADQYRNVRITDETEVYSVFKECLNHKYDHSLEPLLADALEYGKRFASDADFRTEAQKSTEGWLAGKPKDLISEYKLFGD